MEIWNSSQNKKALPERENRTHDFLAKLRLKAAVKAVDETNYIILPSLWTKQSFNLGQTSVNRLSNQPDVQASSVRSWVIDFSLRLICLHVDLGIQASAEFQSKMALALRHNTTAVLATVAANLSNGYGNVAPLAKYLGQRNSHQSVYNWLTERIKCLTKHTVLFYKLL